MHIASFRTRRQSTTPPVMTANRYLATNAGRAIGLGAMCLLFEAHTALAARKTQLIKKIPVLAAAAVLAVTVLATTSAAPADATIITSGVPCSWSTGPGWHFSPYYNVQYTYLGHDIIGGHWYRAFYVTNFASYWDRWDQYCG